WPEQPRRRRSDLHPSRVEKSPVLPLPGCPTATRRLLPEQLRVDLVPGQGGLQHRETRGLSPRPSHPEPGQPHKSPLRIVYPWLCRQARRAPRNRLSSRYHWYPLSEPSNPETLPRRQFPETSSCSTSRQPDHHHWSREYCFHPPQTSDDGFRN